jgi:hypothetical protein
MVNLGVHFVRGVVKPGIHFVRRLGAKYQADLRNHDRPGEYRVVVTIRPTRVNAVDMRG